MHSDYLVLLLCLLDPSKLSPFILLNNVSQNKFVAITSKGSSPCNAEGGSTVKRTMVCVLACHQPSAKLATHAERKDGRLEGYVSRISHHSAYYVHEERQMRVAYVTLSSHLNRNQAISASVIASGVEGLDNTTENGF